MRKLLVFPTAKNVSCRQGEEVSIVCAFALQLVNTHSEHALLSAWEYVGDLDRDDLMSTVLGILVSTEDRVARKVKGMKNETTGIFSTSLAKRIMAKKPSASDWSQSHMSDIFARDDDVLMWGFALHDRKTYAVVLVSDDWLYLGHVYMYETSGESLEIVGIRKSIYAVQSGETPVAQSILRGMADVLRFSGSIFLHVMSPIGIMLSILNKLQLVSTRAGGYTQASIESGLPDVPPMEVFNLYEPPEHVDVSQEVLSKFSAGLQFHIQRIADLERPSDAPAEETFKFLLDKLNRFESVVVVIKNCFDVGFQPRRLKPGWDHVQNSRDIRVADNATFEDLCVVLRTEIISQTEHALLLIEEEEYKDAKMHENPKRSKLT